jgi:hypothetical protein
MLSADAPGRVVGVAMLEGVGSALLESGDLCSVATGSAGTCYADTAAEAEQPLEMSLPEYAAVAAESETAGSCWQTEVPAHPDSSIALVDRQFEPAAKDTAPHSAATLSAAEEKQFDMCSEAVAEFVAPSESYYSPATPCSDAYSD